MISNQTALRRRSSFSCYIVISSVIFLALLFVVIQEHQLVVAQTVDNAIRSFSSNNTELRKPSSIGLTAIEISREISNVLDYHGEKGGLLVTDVRPDGPADHAGIKGGNQSFPINGLNVKLGGDIILTVDNNTFVNDTEFQRYYKHKVNGESMALKILRDGKSKMVNLIVGQNPSQIYENSTKFRDPNYINLSTYQDINFGIKIGYP